MLEAIMAASLVVLYIAAQQVFHEEEMRDFNRSRLKKMVTPARVAQRKSLYEHQDVRIRNRCGCVTCKNARQREMMSKN